MGHDSLITTLNSYGHITVERQTEIIGSLGKVPPSTEPDYAMAEKIAAKVAVILDKKR